MKYLTIFLLLLPPFLAYTQTEQEFKIDLIGSTLGGPVFSYDINIAKKWSVEATLGYRERDVFHVAYDTTNEFTLLDYDRVFLIAGISVKHYFNTQYRGTGLYVGLFNRNELKIYQDKGWLPVIESIYEHERKQIEEERIHLGLLLGHKWCINPHFVVEPQFRYGFNLAANTSFPLTNMALALSLGYRW